MSRGNGSYGRQIRSEPPPSPTTQKVLTSSSEGRLAEHRRGSRCMGLALGIPAAPERLAAAKGKLGSGEGVGRPRCGLRSDSVAWQAPNESPAAQPWEANPIS
jgi:hypothetical protein